MPPIADIAATTDATSCHMLFAACYFSFAAFLPCRDIDAAAPPIYDIAAAADTPAACH